MEVGWGIRFAPARNRLGSPHLRYAPQLPLVLPAQASALFRWRKIPLLPANVIPDSATVNLQLAKPGRLRARAPLR